MLDSNSDKTSDDHRIRQTTSFGSTLAYSVVFIFVLGLAFTLQDVSAQQNANQKPTVPPLNSKNVNAWRTHIKPSTAELGWTKIDWLPDLKSGLEEAAKTGKPILLWTMNGHPLGCT